MKLYRRFFYNIFLKDWIKYQRKCLASVYFNDHVKVVMLVLKFSVWPMSCVVMALRLLIEIMIIIVNLMYLARIIVVLKCINSKL